MHIIFAKVQHIRKGQTTILDTVTQLILFGDMKYVALEIYITIFLYLLNLDKQYQTTMAELRYLEWSTT